MIVHCIQNVYKIGWMKNGSSGVKAPEIRIYYLTGNTGSGVNHNGVELYLVYCSDLAYWLRNDPRLRGR